MAIEPTSAAAVRADPAGRRKLDPARSAGTPPGPDGAALPAGKAAEVAKLKARDAQVRAHEAAHLAAAGGLAQGGASYTYQRGPDGRAYAVGGEVNIDTGGVPGDPQATQAKAMQVVAAALAPADPSGQDLAVAGRARAVAAQAAGQTRAEDQAGTEGRPRMESRPGMEGRPGTDGPAGPAATAGARRTGRTGTAAAVPGRHLDITV